MNRLKNLVDASDALARAIYEVRDLGMRGMKIHVEVESAISIPDRYSTEIANRLSAVLSASMQLAQQAGPVVDDG